MTKVFAEGREHSVFVELDVPGAPGTTDAPSAPQLLLSLHAIARLEEKAFSRLFYTIIQQIQAMLSDVSFCISSKVHAAGVGRCLLLTCTASVPIAATFVDA